MTTTTKNMQPDQEQVKPSHQSHLQPPPMSGREDAARVPETNLVSFGERVTYTFAHGREVGSIHFDRTRGEIFYKGHNIRNMDMDLEEWQMQMLEGLRKILETQEQGKRFAESYGKTLDKVVLEKRKHPK